MHILLPNYFNSIENSLEKQVRVYKPVAERG